MKNKSYEKNCIFIITFIVTLVLIVLLMISFYISKIPNFIIYQGVVQKDDLVVLLVKNNELKYLYNNKNLYYKDKKYSYKIKQVVSNVLERDKESYDEVLLEFSFNKLKENDAINISVIKNKIRGFNIFKVIWR